MCAIFGIIGEGNQNILKKMSDCQKYRGPDEQRFFVDKKRKISIGMNRLSVIDKKMGSQPMLSHDGRFLIVFNGAIYNFKEIRSFLIKKKINFKTNSDTEVLVNAYSYWNNKSFNYFDGMWALAIYDFKLKKLILSRDYIGQKPLFYLQEDKKFVFSSQLNGIFKFRKNFKILDKSYEDYLRFNFFPAPMTLYKDVYQMSPGEIIELNKFKINKKKYWNLEKGPDYNNFFHKISKNKFNSNFSKIINNFSIADRKVGLCLSGGLDSNLIKVFLMKVQKKINSFTIGFKEKSYDESLYVKNSKFNKNTKKILNNKKLFESVNLLKKKIFFPIGDSSIVPTFELYKMAKNKTNVTMSGDGGDELFFGYISFKGFYIAYLIKKIIPTFILSIIKKPFLKIKITTEYMNIQKKIKLFFKFLDKKNYLLNSFWISNFDDSDAINYFKKKNINEKTQSIKKIKNIYLKSKNKMRFAQIYYIKYFLPLILAKVDSASMLNSVENRAPLLSKDFLNFSLNTPIKNNFSLFNNKKLFKEIFHNEFYEENEIAKHGFAFNKNIILLNQKFIRKNIKKKYIYNPNFFERRYTEYLDGNYEHEQYLWSELMLNFSRQNLNC